MGFIGGLKKLAAPFAAAFGLAASGVAQADVFNDMNTLITKINQGATVQQAKDAMPGANAAEKESAYINAVYHLILSPHSRNATAAMNANAGALTNDIRARLTSYYGPNVKAPDGALKKTAHKIENGMHVVTYTNSHGNYLTLRPEDGTDLVNFDPSAVKRQTLALPPGYSATYMSPAKAIDGMPRGFTRINYELMGKDVLPALLGTKPANEVFPPSDSVTIRLRNSYPSAAALYDATPDKMVPTGTQSGANLNLSGLDYSGGGVKIRFDTSNMDIVNLSTGAVIPNVDARGGEIVVQGQTELTQFFQERAGFKIRNINAPSTLKVTLTSNLGATTYLGPLTIFPKP